MKTLNWIHGLSAGLVMLLRVTAVGIYLVTSGDYPVSPVESCCDPP